MPHTLCLFCKSLLKSPDNQYIKLSRVTYIAAQGLLESPANQYMRFCVHCNDVIMSTIASQITSLAIVYSIVYSGADQSKHQSSASLAFVRGIHPGPVNSPHKGPVTRKMFPFDDVIMRCLYCTPRYTMYCFIRYSLRALPPHFRQIVAIINTALRHCKII